MMWLKTLQVRYRVSTKIFTALPTARLVHHTMQHCISSTVLTEVRNSVFFERQSTAAPSHHICVRWMHLSCSPGARRFSRSHVPAALLACTTATAHAAQSPFVVNIARITSHASASLSTFSFSSWTHLLLSFLCSLSHRSKSPRSLQRHKRDLLSRRQTRIDWLRRAWRQAANTSKLTTRPWFRISKLIAYLLA